MVPERGSNPPPCGEPDACDARALRRFAGVTVRVRLKDGTDWTGVLRTGLLTARSISVYIAALAGEGVTLYIDQIDQIVSMPLPAD